MSTRRTTPADHRAPDRPAGAGDEPRADRQGHPQGHPHGRRHLQALGAGLDSLRGQLPLLDRWAAHLARVVLGGGRLLAAGNGGSAAEAQHLTAELVGRYCEDRQPLAAVSLHAETSSLTAILNDYGPDEVFARQVQAHGRPGDVLVLLSTSGTSRNVLAAAKRARECGLTVWALTGREPNPLAALADEALCIDAASTATVQEAHLVAVHVLCTGLDRELAARGVPVGRTISLTDDALSRDTEVPA